MSSSLNQVIDKKLSKSDEDYLNNQDSFWDSYQAGNLASAISQLNTPSSRNKLWKKFLNGNEKAKLKLKILRYNPDRKHIYDCLRELKMQESKETKIGNLWKKGRFAVLDYEYQ